MGKLLRIGLLLVACAATCPAALVTITETVRDAQNNPAVGYITLSWGTFLTASNQLVGAGSLRVNLSSGVFSATVQSTTDATTVPGGQPAGITYTATYNIAGVRLSEQWSVPPSPSTTTIQAVRVPGVISPTAIVRLSQLESDGASGEGVRHLAWSDASVRWKNFVFVDSDAPLALGTATSGSATVASRKDHVHPAADLATGAVTGTLPYTKGGTGVTAAADDTVLIGSGTAWVAQTIPDCDDTGGQHLNYDQGTNAFACGTSGSGGLADPGSNGVVVRTSAGVTTARTITGTASVIVVTNGDGVSGNPTLNVGANVASATPTDDQVLVGSGSAWVGKTIPDCDDTGGQHLNYDQGTNAFACGTSGGGGGATGVGPLYTSTGSATVGNTGTETTIIGSGTGSLTLPAAWFSAAGDNFRFLASGYYSTQASPNTLRIRLKFGSTAILDTTAQTPPGSQTNTLWTMECLITARTVGVSGTLISNCGWTDNSTAVALGNFQAVNTSTVTVDTTGTLVVDLTAQWGGSNPSDTITGTNFTMYRPGSQGPEFVDNTFRIIDNGDTTKKVAFQVSGVSTSTVRTATVPDADSTLVVPDTGASNNFLTAISAAGAISKAQPAFSNLSGSATMGQLPSNQKISSFGIVLDGGGSAITTGIKGDVVVEFACTITQWELLADQSGSIVIDLWKDTYANFPPVVGDSITGSEKPTLSSQTKNQDLSPFSGGTTSVSAGDIIRFNVDSASTVTLVTLSVRCDRS